VGAAGTILRYQGETWGRYKSPVENHLLALHFDPKGRGWAVGASGVVITCHNGVWTEVPSPSKKALYTVTTDDKNNVWVAGKGGKIFQLPRDAITK
jgi:hypothetical protein